MLELGINITKSKILLLYESNGTTKYKVLNNIALFKYLKVDCYLHYKSSKVHAFTAF